MLSLCAPRSSCLIMEFVLFSVVVAFCLCLCLEYYRKNKFVVESISLRATERCMQTSHKL